MKTLLKNILMPAYKQIKSFYLRCQQGQVSNNSKSGDKNGFIYTNIDRYLDKKINLK